MVLLFNKVLVAIRSVHGNMASGTIAFRSNAEIGATVGRRYPHFRAMTALAELPDIAHFEHVTPGRAVVLMAGHTSIVAHRIMFIDERSAFILVAPYAECLRIGPQLMLFIGAMWVVAARAGHCTFFHLMMRGLVEIGLHVRVAGETQLHLRSTDHRALSDGVHLELLIAAWMDIVAGDARNTGAGMLAESCMALFTGLFVALETGFGELCRSE